MAKNQGAVKIHKRGASVVNMAFGMIGVLIDTD